MEENRKANMYLQDLKNVGLSDEKIDNQENDLEIDFDFPYIDLIIKCQCSELHDEGEWSLFDDQYHKMAASSLKCKLEPSKEMRIELSKAVSAPNCEEISTKAADDFWTHRNYIVKEPACLTKFLKSCLNDSKKYIEAIQMIQEWEEIKFEHAIYLLSGPFSANSCYDKDRKQMLSEEKVEFVKSIRRFAAFKISKSYQADSTNVD